MASSASDAGAVGRTSGGRDAAAAGTVLRRRLPDSWRSAVPVFGIVGELELTMAMCLETMGLLDPVRRARDDAGVVAILPTVQ